jgi:hypothetical protein
MDIAVEQLNEFADLCRETTGGTFTISKNKAGKWVVSFTGLSQQFHNEDIQLAVVEARNWLLKTRKPVEIETKYTLYGCR